MAQPAEGMLAPTQSVDLTALEDQLGMHRDTWDEAARRAMDVVNRGAESPWAAVMGLGSAEEALSYVRDFLRWQPPGGGELGGGDCPVSATDGGDAGAAESGLDVPEQANRGGARAGF